MGRGHNKNCILSMDHDVMKLIFASTSDRSTTDMQHGALIGDNFSCQ